MGLKVIKGKKGFISQGKGVRHSSKVYGAKFPDHISAIIEDLPNRSDYIRNAVLRQLKEDGLID